MKYTVIVAILILFQSCANQTAPTGGPRDEKPPELITSTPTDQEINVSTDEIRLTFDEYLKLNKPKEQIIISPRFDSEVEYTSRKNTVLIKFEKDLPDSTTFTINFREGVQDITEGNSPDNLKLAFSTGEYLDSMYITGKVYDLFTNKLIKDYAMFLYDHRDTLNIFEDPPLYYTKTSDSGSFALENLKAGLYDIYAVHDKNKNLILDLESEAYSFLDSTLILRNSVISDLTLKSYVLNALPIDLRSARQNGTVYELKYNKYIASYTYSSADSSAMYSNFLDSDHKSILFYKPENYIDSLLTYITVTDSLDYSLQDTLYIKFEETTRRARTFESKVQLDMVFPSTGVLKGELIFNKPISSYNFDSLYLFLDSANIIPLDTSKHLKVNYYKDQFTLSFLIDQALFESKDEDIKSNTSKKAMTLPNDSTSIDTTTVKSIPPPKPHLYIGKGAFISVDKDSIKNQINYLKFAKKEDFATLFIEVDTKSPSYIIQLTDSKYKTIQEVSNKPNFSFDDIPPGEYFLRIIKDENNNRKWDTGDIYSRTLPEKIIIYESNEGTRNIVLRANWETPITLTF